MIVEKVQALPKSNLIYTRNCIDLLVLHVFNQENVGIIHPHFGWVNQIGTPKRTTL